MKKLKLKQWDLVLIMWQDHNSFSECYWRSPEEYKNSVPLNIETVGFLVNETPDVYTVVGTHSLSTDGSFGDVTILKPCVINITKLLGKHVEPT